MPVASSLVPAVCALAVAAAWLPGADAVEVSPGGCGTGWTRPYAGMQDFALHNISATAADVRLQDARTGAVFGEVEGLGPGTVRELRARLGPGAYAFVCLHEDADAVTGPTVRIGGAGAGGPAAVPVTRHDLVPPTLDYQRRTARQLDDLAARTDALGAAVAAGDRDAARAAWLSAHLAYARLGAAYGAFGAAGETVDRTTAGLPGGVHDPRFTGFHRVEYGLWHGESGPGLRRAARRLAADVRTLRTREDRTRMDPADLPRRAHEILEDAFRQELTGRTDYGSGTGLATVRADVDGTRAVLARLRPLLRSRYAGLPLLDRRLDRVQRTLDAQRRGGRWTPPLRLARADRERVDAELGDVLERLAEVAALCEPRRTA
ncbi:EfeM/EfeO family lipoprotein [Streptomyces morookaense]|nr:EfeM/EfeO family lipoprotein [Streptomyces morookaense]GHF39033.1 iron transporter [Streptomyces morookaense]